MVEPVPGHKSKNGKYLTYNATVTFQNKTEMTLLSEELATVESVKFLL
jgi:putative lipoic acid-binding regulatory protein